MKLTATIQISVDGVIQGPGVNKGEDEQGHFNHQGWAHFDEDAGRAMGEIFQRSDAFLFGRRTYRHFADTWGTWPDKGNDPIWTALYTKPFYVPSTTRPEPHPLWHTTFLSQEVASTIRDLKAQPGRELQVYGSGVLLRWLLDNDLIEELNLFTFPVVVGQGIRLFPETGKDMALELDASRSTAGGITIQVYRPTNC